MLSARFPTVNTLLRGQSDGHACLVVPGVREGIVTQNCGCEQRGETKYLCPYHEGFEDGQNSQIDKYTCVCDHNINLHIYFTLTGPPYPQLGSCGFCDKCESYSIRGLILE